MPDIALRIEQSDGTVRGEIDAKDAEYKRSFDEQGRGDITTPRSEWANLESNIDERNDKFFIVDGSTKVFGGRFDDVKTSRPTVSVRINSPEIDASDAEPTSNNLTYENVDPETIAKDAIDSVPTLTQGTISLSQSLVSYTISYGSQSKVLYDLREIADAEFRYNTDFSVDVVDSLGSDKSADITISPSESNVSSFNKTVDNREDVTHLKGLGGQAGPGQVTAEAIASSYVSGEKQKWRRYKNKEILEKSRLQDIIDNLVEEYDGEPRYIDMEADVHNEDLELGDTVKVEYNEENINGDFRVVEITEKWDKAPTTSVVLSNRNLTREKRSRKRNDDLERFNRGYGGFIDRDNQTVIGRQPVNSSLNATGTYPYPNDVVREDKAEIFIEGLPYRAYSSGGATNPEFNNVDSSTTNVQTNTVDDSSWTDFGSYDPSGSSQAMWGYAYFDVDAGSFNIDNIGLLFRLNFDFGSSFYPNSNGEEVMTVGTDLGNGQQFGYISWYLPGDYAGSLADISPELKINSAAGYSGDMEMDWSVFFVGTHTHPADPGVEESFSGTTYYPSNVDLLIDGTSQGLSLGGGSGTFTETVDISGSLSGGNNSIELTSDTRGHVRAVISTELFRRGVTTS